MPGHGLPPPDLVLEKALLRLQRAQERRFASVPLPPFGDGPAPLLTKEALDESDEMEQEFALALIEYMVVLLRGRKWPAGKIASNLTQQLPDYEEEIRAALKKLVA